MKDRPIGLISAIDEEASGLASGVSVAAVRTVAGRAFRAGRLAGCPVVLVRAGIGKVNAAMAATLLCADFGCGALVMAGVAGSLDPNLGLGEIVVGRRIVCHDYGAFVDGGFAVYQPGAPPLPHVARRHGYELPRPLLGTLETALAGRAVRFGTIVSGDALVSCETARERLRHSFGGDAVEMEGAAVAQVARRFGVPAVAIRAVSDLAGAGHAKEVRSHLGTAALAAAAATRAVLPPILEHINGSMNNR